MHCPICHRPDTKVIDSRLLLEGDSVRRRRRCLSCEHRFTTYEKFQLQLPMLIKSDGRRESFDPEKIIRGLKKACQKRPISVEQLDQIIEDIQRDLIACGEKEVAAKELGEWVMDKLYALDPVSYVRFASFYWDYRDIEDFVKSLQGRKNSINQINQKKELENGKDELH